MVVATMLVVVALPWFASSVVVEPLLPSVVLASDVVGWEIVLMGLLPW